MTFMMGMAVWSFRKGKHVRNAIDFDHRLNVYVDKVHGKKATFERQMLFHGSVQCIFMA